MPYLFVPTTLSSVLSKKGLRSQSTCYRGMTSCTRSQRVYWVRNDSERQNSTLAMRGQWQGKSIRNGENRGYQASERTCVLVQPTQFQPRITCTLEIMRRYRYNRNLSSHDIFE